MWLVNTNSQVYLIICRVALIAELFNNSFVKLYLMLVEHE